MKIRTLTLNKCSVFEPSAGAQRLCKAVSANRAGHKGERNVLYNCTSIFALMLTHASMTCILFICMQWFQDNLPDLLQSIRTFGPIFGTTVRIKIRE